MIRLLATDLDGTLLEPDGSLPEGVFEIARELDALGIRFTAASGRQFGNLRRLFAPIAQQMAFVCENGAVNALGSEVIGTFAIPRALVMEMIADLQALKMNLLLSGRHTCYVFEQQREFADYMVYDLKNTVTVVEDLSVIPEEFLKISGHTPLGVAQAAPALLEKWNGRATATIAGKDWFDFTISNKGMGIRMLMDKLGIKREEIMAFGDNFNDESMLDEVGHPFLMESANPALRRPGITLCQKVMPVLEALVQAKGRLP